MYANMVGWYTGAPFSHNHLSISIYIATVITKLQLEAISVGMLVMWEWCYVITSTATLYVYFVDQSHPYILISCYNYLFVLANILCTVIIGIIFKEGQ